MDENLNFPDLDLDPDWRIETKYRVSLRQYYALKNALTPFLSRDHFTKREHSKRYLVRSLYFDTLGFRLYNEKISGNCNRIKFRLRTYDDSPEAKGQIRVEMKVRKGNIMEKYGNFVPYETYQNFISGGNLPMDDHPVLNEFERYRHRWRLLPVTIVEYQREGYHSRTHDGIRVTFDHGVKSAAACELFPQKTWWRRHYEQQVVLEIKHRQQMPDWMDKIIRYFNLKVVANSKYAMSVEVGRNDIVLPAWRHL